MKKIAIFVEGRTEAVFLENFIETVAGRHNVLIETKKIIGGATVARSVSTISAVRQPAGEEYFVLIYDCGGDEQVKTRIQEEHNSLSAKGYFFIIGIRDVRPRFSAADIPKLQAGLRKYIKTSLIPVHFILSIMEFEAWFLAEHTHFEKVDPRITIQEISASTGFDPSIEDMTSRSNPTEDLDTCYQIAGLQYIKGGDQKTMQSLDYTRIYIELGNKIPSIEKLNHHLDDFLSLQ